MPPTKRSILRISAKIFDPIGLISPITVNFKMWFQELCSSKVDWDVILQNEVKALSVLRVPRCYFVIVLGKPVSHEIHGFIREGNGSCGVFSIQVCERESECASHCVQNQSDTDEKTINP